MHDSQSRASVAAQLPRLAHDDEHDEREEAGPLPALGGVLLVRPSPAGMSSRSSPKLWTNYGLRAVSFNGLRPNAQATVGREHFVRH